MCGSLQFSAVEKAVMSANTFPKEWFDPELKRDLPCSSHRFMKSEKLEWWKQQGLALKEVLLKADRFKEKDTWIEIPEGFEIQAAVHLTLQIPRNWVFSIITVNPEDYEEGDELYEVAKEASRIHHRMPLLRRVA